MPDSPRGSFHVMATSRRGCPFVLLCKVLKIATNSTPPTATEYAAGLFLCFVIVIVWDSFLILQDNRRGGGILWALPCCPLVCLFACFHSCDIFNPQGEKLGDWSALLGCVELNKGGDFFAEVDRDCFCFLSHNATPYQLARTK